MSGSTNTSRILNELKDSFLARGLIVVAGAGVSLQTAGFPQKTASKVAGWQGFLESGIEYCERYRLVSQKDAAIARVEVTQPDNTNDLIHVADKIAQWMEARKNGRLQWIKETIGSLEVHDPSLVVAIQSLGGLIATLNYDDLIHDVTKRECIHWNELHKVNGNILSHPSQYILHIHGHWTTLDSIVLDRASYDALLNHEKLQLLIKGFAVWNTMLFVGCSGTLEDPNFQMLLKWCSRALDGLSHRHFILCRESEEDSLIDMVKSYGFLEPLVYGKTFEELAPFLDTLAKHKGSSSYLQNPPLTTLPATGVGGLPVIQTAAKIWKLFTS